MPRTRTSARADRPRWSRPARPAATATRTRCFSPSTRTARASLFGTSESLVATDTDGRFDIYERAGGATTLVSTGPAGGNGNFDAFFSGASQDGTRVFFETSEQLASDSDALPDVYERTAGATTKLSTGEIGGNGPEGAFFVGSSQDGSRVWFASAEKLAAHRHGHRNGRLRDPPARHLSASQGRDAVQGGARRRLRGVHRAEPHPRAAHARPAVRTTRLATRLNRPRRNSRSARPTPTARPRSRAAPCASPRSSATRARRADEADVAPVPGGVSDVRTPDRPGRLHRRAAGRRCRCA